MATYQVLEMIILDTNVLSALMTPGIHQPVIRWLDRQDPDAIWTTVISLYEVRAGIHLLPEGRRKRGLNDNLDDVLARQFQARMAWYDHEAAEQAARIGTAQVKSGLNVEIQDIMIAGIVVARDAKLATRNVKHFRGITDRLVNPWE